MATDSKELDQPVTATIALDQAGPDLFAYVSGELDAYSVPSIFASVQERADERARRIWFDLSATTFCDSAGFMLLYKLHRMCDSNGSRLVISNPTPAVKRVIEILDPSHVLQVDSVPRATAAAS